jgi:hypothetical protein
VQASCGCTTPNWTGGVYKPQSTGKIDARYNAASEGFFKKIITVTTSEGAIVLSITGTVLNPAAYEIWKHEQDSIAALKNPAPKTSKKESKKKSNKKEKPSKKMEGDLPKSLK